MLRSFLLVLTLVLAGCASTPVEPAGVLVEPTTATPRIELLVEVLIRNANLVEANAMFDDGLLPDQVQWSWGDGTRSIGNPEEHTYRSGGIYTIQAIANHPEEGGRMVELTIDTGTGTVGSPTSGSRPDGVELHPPRPAVKEPTPPPRTSVPLAEAPFHLTLNLTRLELVSKESFVLESIDWGDGTENTEMSHHYKSVGQFDLTILFDGDKRTRHSVDVSGYIPHVIVGIGDSGFNVYHDVYARPELTMHPCLYIQDFPCDLPALKLTLDEPDWDKAFAQDLPIWQSIQPGDAFWIPGTNIVYAGCYTPYQGSNVGSTNPTAPVDYCIIDDSSMHGTGTSSSVLSENPDALLAIAEGNSGSERFLRDAGIPIDVQSHSWGSAVPIPVLGSPVDERIFVVASGNEGAFPVLLDGKSAGTYEWTIGAADAGSRSEPGYSGWKTMDFVSEYCRETAQTRTTTEMRSQYCGTSFSAPTFAGAISRVILELRMESGYTGSNTDGFVDPILGIRSMDLRNAVNHTATYEPEDQWNDGGDLMPLIAPWYQWGWGYYDSTRVEATLLCLREQVCPEREPETVLYMETLWTVREAQDVP